jgi:hypothetical protein
MNFNKKSAFFIQYFLILNDRTLEFHCIKKDYVNGVFFFDNDITEQEDSPRKRFFKHINDVAGNLIKYAEEDSEYWLAIDVIEKNLSVIFSFDPAIDCKYFRVAGYDKNFFRGILSIYLDLLKNSKKERFIKFHLKLSLLYKDYII